MPFFWSIRKLLISFIQHWLFINDLQAQIRKKWVKFWCGFWTPYLTGRIADCLIPRALPWARSFCPFRACCCGLFGLLGVAAYMGILPFLGVLLWAFGPSGRAAVGFWAFWACWVISTIQKGLLLWDFLAFACTWNLLTLKELSRKKRENDGNLRK